MPILLARLGETGSNVDTGDPLSVFLPPGGGCPRFPGLLEEKNVSLAALESGGWAEVRSPLGQQAGSCIRVLHVLRSVSSVRVDPLI